MARHRSPRREGARGRRFGSPREWVGGRISPPFFVTDREEPYRPDLVLWVELPDLLVVGHDVVPPESLPGAVGRALRGALAQPLAGRPRRPRRIRVATESLAAEVRDVVGDRIPIVVAPTPEMDEVLEFMAGPVRGFAGEAPSYLEQGRVSPAVVADLFTAASGLYRIAPWKIATDGQLLRLDIPALGVEGASVSIIGMLGESTGILIFPSLAGYDAFAAAAAKPLPERGPLDLGTDWLALCFEHAADLPPSMRREVAAHDWPVADPRAYPRVERHDRDGAIRPLTDKDVRIASACASALAAFCLRHRDVFEDPAPDPICESIENPGGVVVRFTVPYQALSWFDAEESPPPAPARGKVGRNDPCPCGSGKKYKKCHLGLDETRPDKASSRGGKAASDGAGRHDEEMELDRWLVSKMIRFAMDRFGRAVWNFEKDFDDPDAVVPLAVPWSLYHFQVRGKSILEWFLEERGSRLSAAERGWLAAQQAAWLSVWEVVDVEPGVGMTLRDLLSHETRRVIEVSGSRTLVVRDAILTRVVDHAGSSSLCGVHPRPLPPADADGVVKQARRRLRRKRAVPLERLRDERLGRSLIRWWEEAVEELDLRASIPPDICNTDGDPLLPTADVFEVAPGAEGEVASCLAAMEGVEAPDALEAAEGEGGEPRGDPDFGAGEHGGLGGDVPPYRFVRGGTGKYGLEDGGTLVGLARLSGGVLRLETNSTRRADTLRKRVEKACGDRISHCSRERTKVPLPPRGAPPAGTSPVGAPGAGAPSGPEVDRVLLEFKQRHYQTWPDEPLPALGGKTPRQAVRTARGREAVDMLLKQMENLERRGAGTSAFDFSALRAELHLD